ncbi:MAG: hypothetical protein QG625_2150 [Cyanobacteriota bacterium erpe_2018_sw_39hr_WHONDRS-SW48-000098_B_bin.30]|jgi:hypothetical protein|nr:hypothetical protein [Candidatus Obscuribacter sp.]MDQ5965995.1 hypothetical protein [Cyanobacteriota bacterium erpe_2018_sw_39hr_WHONDRS-SW48-000098_B_bin.30]
MLKTFNAAHCSKRLGLLLMVTLGCTGFLVDSKYPGLMPVLASSPDQSHNNCQERAPVFDDTPQMPAKSVQTKSAAVFVSAEEELLSEALGSLKRNDLNKAINLLTRLNKEHPDQDYALFLRLAIKRQDGEQWYRFQKWVKRKDETPAFISSPNATPQRKVSIAINQLKRETWFILSTGRATSR